MGVAPGYFMNPLRGFRLPRCPAGGVEHAQDSARPAAPRALGVKRIPFVIEFFQPSLRSIESMGDLVLQQNEKPSAGVIGFLATTQGL